MAGDWIKMRADLRDDPAVFKLAEILNVDELHVIGCLFCFWTWVDKHAVDGRVDGATSRLVDKVSMTSGFADALVAVGWIQVDESGVTIPNFQRHNGESAKERGLKNARQARWRANNAPVSSVDATPSTKASTREEKRREDISTTDVVDRGATKPRAARLPDNWLPDDDLVAWARNERSDLNIQIVTDSFRDYWIAQPGAKGAKLNWDATFRNWVRNQRQSQAPQATGETAYQRNMREKVEFLTGKAPGSNRIAATAPVGNVINVTPITRKLGGE